MEALLFSVINFAFSHWFSTCIVYVFSVKFLRNFTVLWWVAKIQTNQSVIQSYSKLSGGCLRFVFVVIYST